MLTEEPESCHNYLRISLLNSGDFNVHFKIAFLFFFTIWFFILFDLEVKIFVTKKPTDM